MDTTKVIIKAGDVTVTQAITVSCKHDYGELIAEVPAACETTGMRAHYICSKCNEWFNENEEATTEDALIIAASGHKAANEWKSDGASHWKMCINKGCNVELEKAAHAGGTATCTEEAVCEVCHEKYGQCKQHEFGEMIAEKAATCTETGTKAHFVCSACNKVFDENQVETTADALVIDALGHDNAGNWNYDDTDHWKVCSRCDEELEKAAHTGGTATCQQKAVCEVCGQEYGELGTHDYVEVAEKAATCTDAGTKAHFVCSVCDKLFDTNKVETTEDDLVLDAVGHTVADEWTANEINHWKACSKCGEVIEGTEATHHGGTATCEKQAVCADCGQAYGELTEHTYGDLIAEKAATCMDAGTKAHFVCSVCNKVFDENKVKPLWML